MDNPNMARAQAKEAALPPERLRELMDYDPETGFLTSRAKRGIRWPGGRRIGTPAHAAYVAASRELHGNYGRE